METHEILHYYLAQIAAAIYQVNSKKPGSIKVEDCLLKFKRPEEENPEARMERSKMVWGMIAAAATKVRLPPSYKGTIPPQLKPQETAKERR